MYILNLYIGGIKVNFKKIIASAVSILFVSVFAVSGNLSVSAAIDVQNVEETDSSVEVNTKEQFIDALLTSEDVWTESPQGYTRNMHNSDVYCWFEDLNMNGTPELVIGPMVGGAHVVHDFEVWTYDNGTLEKFGIYYPNGLYSNTPEYSNSLSLWLHDIDETVEGKASFRYQLFQDKTTGEYKYVCINVDGNGLESNRGLEVISCNDISINTGFRLTITDAGYSCKVNGSSVSKEEFINEYDEFFSNLTPYEISTKDFLYKSYIGMGAEDKKDILSESYDAWSYAETNQVILPLSEDVLKIKEACENENKCGDNATWSFDETTGTLTISGTGDMYDYYENIHFSTDERSSPWLREINNISDIKNIVIEEGITSIGAKAFYDLAYVNSVSLPSTLTKIGAEAFRVFSTDKCASMFRTITIPDSVTEIGKKALGYYDTSSNDGDVQYFDGILYGLTINGKAGSVAEKYAKDNNISFSLLSDADNENQSSSTDNENNGTEEKRMEKQ